MAVNGFALSSIAAGSIFVYASLSGKSVLKSVQAIVAGTSPVLVPATNTITGSTVTGSATSGPAPSAAAGSVGQYQSYAFSQFGKYGWGTDQQQYLTELWNKESGWNPAAVNPSSGAAGIPQDITGNMHGGWQGQIDWGLSYIRSRYGTPQMAWAHETANNWY
jgi:hypothetical protein